MRSFRRVLLGCARGTHSRPAPLCTVRWTTRRLGEQVRCDLERLWRQGRVTRSVADAQTMLTDPNVVFVDLRDPRELEREGMVPNAFHATRGMLEFWIDPEVDFGINPDLPQKKRDFRIAPPLLCGISYMIH